MFAKTNRNKFKLLVDSNFLGKFGLFGLVSIFSQNSFHQLEFTKSHLEYNKSELWLNSRFQNRVGLYLGCFELLLKQIFTQNLQKPQLM